MDTIVDSFIDKVFMTGPPKWKETDTTDPAFGNPVKFWSYVFIPKDIDTKKLFAELSKSYMFNPTESHEKIDTC